MSIIKENTNDWELFKVWMRVQGTDMDRLSWSDTQIAMKQFENEKI